jgi:glycosyltransferase involved in cell wall biosynthesis
LYPIKKSRINAKKTGGNPKVLMIVSNPFTNDPRVYNEAKTLVQSGYEVTVIAWDRQKSNPQKASWNGIDIVRVQPILPVKLGSGSLLFRAINLILWQYQAYRQALGLSKINIFDFVHCHDFDTLIAGVLLKRKLEIRLIYDLHDIYSYMMTRHFPRCISNMFSILERRLLSEVDRIIDTSVPQTRYLESITDKPVTIIMNCKSLQSLEYQPPNDKDRFNILYLGVLHEGREISMLLDVVSELSDVGCIIGGFGHPKYVRAIEDKCTKVANADFVGMVPYDEVIPMTQKAHAVFFMINPRDANNRIGLGNKQFEAMVCGRPIICTKGTYSGELTEQEGVGLTVELDKESLKQAIIKLRDDPILREKLGRDALRAATREYNWQKQADKLLELYERMR